MRLKWICFNVLILIFCFISYLVLNDKTVFFDSFVYNLFLKNDFFTYFFKFITMFASEIVIGIICLIIFIKNKKYGIIVTFNAINILILNIILKLIFMRDRPFDLMLIEVDGYIFPSGHAMVGAGFYVLILFLMWHFKLEKRKMVSFALSILIFLIGISRIYLGVHYASDVIAGFVISLAYLILYTSMFKRWKLWLKDL